MKEIIVPIEEKVHQFNNKGDKIMEFSLVSIQEAHKLYTGPDFPKLIKAFKSMDMITNIFDLETGKVTYVSRSGDTLVSTGIKMKFDTREAGKYEEAIIALQRNQRGESDFYSFCNEVAKAGIYKWVSDLDAMTCSYFDRMEQVVIIENIPSV